jgi:hypothetical protein
MWDHAVYRDTSLIRSTPPRRTLQQPYMYAKGLTVIQGGGGCFV